jgi:hypothetical protein
VLVINVQNTSLVINVLLLLRSSIHFIDLLEAGNLIPPCPFYLVPGSAISAAKESLHSGEWRIIFRERRSVSMYQIRCSLAGFVTQLHPSHRISFVAATAVYRIVSRSTGSEA